MSARSDEEEQSLQDGICGVPFDPADYARRENELSPDSDSGDGDPSASAHQWVQWAKSHWRIVLAWSFFALLLARCAVALYFAGFWIGYLPKFALLALLTAELFFSRDLCLSLVSCVLLVDSLITDGYILFINGPEWRRISFSWPYESRIQIALATLGLIVIVWRERSIPRLFTAIPLLGIFLLLLVIAIASIR